MSTPVTVCNFGLAKIAETRIKSFTPAQSAVEKFLEPLYPHIKRVELTKHTWLFALQEDVALTLVSQDTTAEYPYRFQRPDKCMRYVRGDDTTWVTRNGDIYSKEDTVKVDYVKEVDETEFDTLFTEAVACQVAMQACEFVTQSNTKAERAKQEYMEAINLAKSLNAVMREPMNVQDDDSVFPFVSGRW